SGGVLMAAVTTASAHRTIEAVFKMESAKLIAGLVRLVRDVGLAEELAQDALVAALEQWPESGVPDKPGAWLMTTAKRRGIDLIRREQRRDDKYAQLGRTLEQEPVTFEAEVAEQLDDDIGDDLLRLIFTACHPVLPVQSQVALTLRLLGGLSTQEIARGFLVSEPTIAQRIVRAKRALSDAKLPFEVPAGAELAPRLESVLKVVYLIFNEGYSATAGDDLMRPSLCEEALRLSRILAELAPKEPEVHGLLALLEIQQSRARTRTDAAGEPVLLLEQDRARWDHLLIRRGLAALDQAYALDAPAGPYVLQAAVAACHARARVPEETDWPQIVRLYGALAMIRPSPIVELNRAVAVMMADGPQRGLDLVDSLTDEPALKGYHLLPSVRGDFLFRLGRFPEAKQEFERAASMTNNERERKLLAAHAAKCGLA
ncbi:MAG: RNA polymerase sigma factor, partial [Terriglobales bacterium]